MDRLRHCENCSKPVKRKRIRCACCNMLVGRECCYASMGHVSGGEGPSCSGCTWNLGLPPGSFNAMDTYTWLIPAAKDTI